MKVILPKFLEGEVRCIGDIKAALEQGPCVQLLKVGNDLLIHGLDEWSGVRWQKLDLNEIVLLKKVVLEAWRVGRSIIQEEYCLTSFGGIFKSSI